MAAAPRVLDVSLLDRPPRGAGGARFVGRTIRGLLIGAGIGLTAKGFLNLMRGDPLFRRPFTKPKNSFSFGRLKPSLADRRRSDRKRRSRNKSSKR